MLVHVREAILFANKVLSRSGLLTGSLTKLPLLSPRLPVRESELEKKRLVALFLAKGSKMEGKPYLPNIQPCRDLLGCGVSVDFLSRHLVWLHAVSTLDDRCSTLLIPIPPLG